jgi:hypothetical protein
MAFVVLACAVSGLSSVRAQTNGVPDEQTLEEALRKKPAVAKPAPNPVTPKKAAAPDASGDSPKPARRGTLVPMVVVSDAACALELNGDAVASLDAGAVKKMSVYPGDQLVKCASTEEPGEVYSGVQNIKAGEQSVLQISLAARVAAVRQAREAQAQSLVAEDASWAQAGQDATPANLQAYLDKYPTGRYVEQARGMLAESTRRAEEDADWKRAQASTRMADVQAYLDNYPAGRHAEAAQQRLDTLKQLPARPELPFTVAEETWQSLESSPYYLSLPQHLHRVTVTVSSTVHGEPVKGSAVSWSQTTTREIVPAGGKCTVLRTATRRSDGGDAVPDVTEDYRCGELKLGTLVNGKLVSQVSQSDVDSFLIEDKALREKPSCDLPSTGPASAFHERLTGAATRYGCGSGEYFFEDLGVWLYELGEMDQEKQQYVLPVPGYHFASAAEGDPGARMTTTYVDFSWTVSN